MYGPSANKAVVELVPLVKVRLYLCLKNADSFQLLTGTPVAIVKQGALATTTATATGTSKRQ